MVWNGWDGEYYIIGFYIIDVDLLYTNVMSINKKIYTIKSEYRTSYRQSVLPIYRRCDKQTVQINNNLTMYHFIYTIQYQQNINRQKYYISYRWHGMSWQMARIYLMWKCSGTEHPSADN